MKKRILAGVLSLLMLLGMFPAVSFSAEEGNSAEYTPSVSARLLNHHDDGEATGKVTAQIEYYLTDSAVETREIKPCDIIFLLEQSTWMNTVSGSSDFGGERQEILNAMETVVDNLMPATTDEHRVAVLGYGRINNPGNGDSYIPNQHPGTKLPTNENYSLNTGYYTWTADGPRFNSARGWSEVNWGAAGSETALPGFPNGYMGNVSYDDVFLSFEKAKEVVDPEKMVAWYAGASRMDAGLAMAEKLAELAVNHKENGQDRKLIVCIAASSLPIQNYGGQRNLRAEASIAAAKQLKEAGALIFGIGDYRKASIDIEGDTREYFNNTMRAICGTAETDNTEEKGKDYFIGLSESGSVPETLMKLITKVGESAAGEVVVPDYAFDPVSTFTGENTSEQTETGTNEITWETVKNTHGIDTDKELAHIDYFAFERYENGVPKFADSPMVHDEVLLSELESDDKLSLCYRGNMIPIPAQMENGQTPRYGYKVRITISDPIKVNYQFLGTSPTDAETPDDEFVSRDSQHLPADFPMTQNHFLFDGWYREIHEDEDATLTVGDKKLIEYDGMVCEDHTGDLTLYGRWLPYYMITYHWVGDIPEDAALPGPDEMLGGDTYVAYTPDTPDGYTFKGWYLEPTFRTRFKIMDNVDRDFDLFGKWKKKSASIPPSPGRPAVPVEPDNPDVNYPTQGESPEDGRTPENPPTGDATDLWMCISLLVTGMAALAALAICNRKYKTKSK